MKFIQLKARFSTREMERREDILGYIDHEEYETDFVSINTAYIESFNPSESKGWTSIFMSNGRSHLVEGDYEYIKQQILSGSTSTL